ncbi:MAG: galactitol-1-phosphate 5-dehydrogenase [Lachnospiraceae bacterium]|jgi:L-iditol 2-dehydrogenase|nr:galactitol-1-phosphate 5-dehydrogenase [Lachnospiraceae bacterium]MCI9282573.1 galactitol-1-phosphate 5-dehydrogenase [Lachnospiraceae bacterium]
MKAWVLHGIDNLVFENVPTPTPGLGEVLIAVKAVGICGSDIPRIYRTGAHRHPLIPGHEFSGEVVGLGEDVDKKWLGQRVGVFPLIPCRVCGPCQKKQFEMCRNYDYLGSRRDGGFAEYVVVPVWNLISLPQQVSFEEAAMLEPMAVAVHAMRRMLPNKDMGAAVHATGKMAISDRENLPDEELLCKIAVCGLGTIGLLLLMFLKEAGVREVYAIGNKDFQKELALKLGLEESCYCDSRRQNQHQWLMERTGGVGVDRYFECVGKKETYALAVDGTAPAGKVVLVGNPYSDMTLEKEVYWKILRNQLTVFGTWNSSYTREFEDDWHYVIERLDRKKIFPAAMISQRFSLENLARGLELMRDKTEDYVKVMGLFE